MEQLQLERQLVAAPERAFGLEADVAVLVVAQLAQFLGQLGGGRLVALAGELLRAGSDVREAEGGLGGRSDQRQQQGSNRISFSAKIARVSRQLR